jgi:hypothetical protein
MPKRERTSDHDAAARTPAAEPPPRGGKLDAKKRAEYTRDVDGAAQWDTSSWSTWIVTGRVLPERCDVTIARTKSQGVGAGGRFELQFEVTRSHIAALCRTEMAEPGVFEIADMVRTALAFPVDYIAFQNRGAYEVILDLCISGQSGQAVPIPVFEPIFEVADVGLCFTAQSEAWKGEMPWAEAAVVELPTALHDLRSAIQYPRRTFEHCRMAIEALRRHFDPPMVRNRDHRHKAGLAAMCEALRVTSDCLNSLDAVAARSRHGELVISIDWEMRRRALELAWELVARFVQHLKGTPNSEWKLLDVRIEDYGKGSAVEAG